MEFNFFNDTGLADCLDLTANNKKSFVILDQNSSFKDIENGLKQLQGERDSCLCGFTFFTNKSFLQTNAKLCQCFQIVFCPVFSSRNRGVNTPKWVIRQPVVMNASDPSSVRFKFLSTQDLKMATANNFLKNDQPYHYFDIDKFFQSDYMHTHVNEFKKRIINSLYPYVKTQNNTYQQQQQQPEEGVFKIPLTESLDSCIEQVKDKKQLGKVLQLYYYYKNNINSFDRDQQYFIRNIPKIIKSIVHSLDYIDQLTVIDVNTRKPIANVRQNYINDINRYHMNIAEIGKLSEIAKACETDLEWFEMNHLKFQDMLDIGIKSAADAKRIGLNTATILELTLSNIALYLGQDENFFKQQDGISITEFIDDLQNAGIYSKRDVIQQNITTMEELMTKLGYEVE